MNVNYFRYLLGEKNIEIAFLAKKFGVSRGHMNWKILHKKFYVQEVEEILKLLNMKFEEVFIDEDKFKDNVEDN